MATKPATEGYFSVLRWRKDPTRDEARNVAVILVDAEGQTGGVKSAKLGAISESLKEQGLLDSVIEGLAQRFASPEKLNLKELKQWRNKLQHSLYVTEPQRVVVSDEQKVLDALFKAYVAPAGGGGGGMTKAKVLDLVIKALRNRGYKMRRGDYVGDFIFDSIVDGKGGQQHSVIEALSFAVDRSKWDEIEFEAAHFLYAIERLSIPGFAVIQAPSEQSHQNARQSHQRVMHWFEHDHIPVIAPVQLHNGVISKLLPAPPVE